MINRYYKNGEKLDVAGLNEITVLLDRSETEVTEIGWNCWTPKQDGPPHKHNDKDQIFYVTGGIGIIKLGESEYPAKEGSLAYVPAGLVHQTITTTEEKLCYMLFNVFESQNKEGHGTFKEHIEKVKKIRRKQADTGLTEVDEELQLTNLKDHKFYKDISNLEINPNKTKILLDRTQTHKNELSLIMIGEGKKESFVSHKDKEKSYFVLEGEGEIIVGEESETISVGHLVYVPKDTPYGYKAIKGNMKLLCLDGFVANDV